MSHQLEKYFSENKLCMPIGIINTISILMILAIVSNSNSVALISQSVADFYNQDLSGNQFSNSAIPIAQNLLENQLFSNNYSLVCSAENELSPTTKNLFNLIEDQCNI